MKYKNGLIVVLALASSAQSIRLRGDDPDEGDGMIYA